MAATVVVLSAINFPWRTWLQHNHVEKNLQYERVFKGQSIFANLDGMAVFQQGYDIKKMETYFALYV